ncbi:MAG: hypothetical protein HUU21_35590 [Polyangiaceae bacterium]|nr:hypothetical protein [Polyangiaceae bacterium]
MLTPFRMTAALAALTGVLSAGSVGCIETMLLEGQIEATRRAATAIDTLQDFDVAKSVAFSGIGQFEGMHYLAPDNADALFMLTKGWAAGTFGFIEDDMEFAEDTEGLDSPLYLYHQARTRAGYDRAIHFGIMLLESKHEGFKEATKNDQTIRAWLTQFDDPEEDTQNLFWTAYAWMSKTNAVKEDPAVVADLFIGVALMERAVELDETFMYGSGHTALGAYHARSAMAELDLAKKHFDKAMELGKGKFLMAQLQYASKYHCLKADKESYERLLNGVVEAGDVLPEQRLSNAIAKRRAKRYLGKERMKLCGF